MRALRRMPAPPQRLCRRRRRRSDAVRLMYTVKEIFFTLQGEGAHTGRAAVFCRFTGCNLWNGKESDRQHAVCKFCDTDFVGVGPDGGKFAEATALADAIDAKWPTAAEHRFVVCTGGEPLL